MDELPETLERVSLVVRVADGLTMDDVHDDAQYLANVLGCHVVYVLDGKIQIIRPTGEDE